MSLQVQVFNEFTPAMFAAFAKKTETDTGTKITENKGTVVHGSFTFIYDYDPTNNCLTVQCLKKPLFIPASTIINGLTEEVLDLKQQVLNNIANPEIVVPGPNTVKVESTEPEVK